MLIAAIAFMTTIAVESCHQACKHAQKTNAALATGTYRFGMKKHSKYKRMNRKSAG
ncbi:MAG TPA: hypothetical protein VFU15_12615 [Bacteroidia bacterium]|nr:hypothetical protein [Bacteroidia bacterium]